MEIDERAGGEVTMDFGTFGADARARAWTSWLTSRLAPLVARLDS